MIVDITEGWMSNRFVSGRQPSARGGMRSNSKLPKGNQHTTPEREPERQARREKKANEVDPAYLFGANPAELREGRRRVRNLLTDDQNDLREVVVSLLKKAKEGSYKHQELVMAYIAGKPIAMQENVSIELTADDVFEAAEKVREQLGSGFVAVPNSGEVEKSA